MLYFAYGSNMSIARIRARVPIARRVCAGTLLCHDLRFHKKGADGSGKCDAFYTGETNHRVFGSLFLIDPAGKAALDIAEGLGVGYAEKQVSVVVDERQRVEALTYYALAIDETLSPYSWYLQHVLIGARESGCPPRYLAWLESTTSIDDHDTERDARERAIHA